MRAFETYRAEIVLGETATTDVPEIRISYYRDDSKLFGGSVSNPNDVAEFVRKLIPGGEMELQEQFFVLYLNRANAIIGYYRHTKGTMTATLVDTRLVLATALKSGATTLILAHNHPSGNTRPSDSDVLMTRKLKTAAESMEILVLDHIIVTKESFFSFANEGLMGIKKPDKEIEKHLNTVIEGDALKVIKTLPDESIDCVVTSPPYWQLRDYGFKSQWGLEKTYMQYLDNMLSLMDEIYRVLKPEGTVWVNLGDSFFGSGNGSGKSPDDDAQSLLKVKVGKIIPRVANTDKENKLVPKCLTMIPHRFAVGCVERGWIVRNDIIWAKPNSLPESVRDRFSKKHEHILFLTKNPDYYFDLDAVREPYKDSSQLRVQYGMTAYGGDAKNTKGPFGKGKKGGGKLTKVKLNPKGKNPGDVTDFWVISTKPGAEKHYATFNTELITKPILAGCPKGGIVLDPFCGTGTTGVRAIELGRNFIGIDGKKEYCRIARKCITEALKEPVKKAA